MTRKEANISRFLLCAPIILVSVPIVINNIFDDSLEIPLLFGALFVTLLSTLACWGILLLKFENQDSFYEPGGSGPWDKTSMSEREKYVNRVTEKMLSTIGIYAMSIAAGIGWIFPSLILGNAAFFRGLAFILFVAAISIITVWISKPDE